MEQDLNNQIPVTDADEISILEIANTVLRQWRMVMALPLGLAFLVGLCTFTQDRMYTVETSFLPQVAEGRGGASTLARQFGVAVAPDRPGQSPQFYADLTRSISLLRKAVETQYQVPGDNGNQRQATLIQFYEIEDEPGKLPPWRRAVEELREYISTSVDVETGMVKLTVESFHPDLAEQIAERFLELLNEINLDVRQSRGQEEGRFIAGRVAEVHGELLAAEKALEEFLKQNREFRNSPELLFEHDRLQRQVAMRHEVYTSLLRSQEEARLDAVRDTPVLAVIDHPAGAAEPKGKGTVLRTLLAFMLGGMLAVFVAFTREYGRRSRESGDPHYQEFQGLVRQIWDELVGRPVRRLRERRARRRQASGPGNG